MNSRKIDCTLTVGLGGSHGTRPVDRTVLAAWLRRLGGSRQVEDIARAVECADGGEATADISMSAEEADAIRLAVLRMTDTATNPRTGITGDELADHRAAAYGLNLFYGAWVRSTGWNGARRMRDQGGSEILGSGYAR